MHRLHPGFIFAIILALVLASCDRGLTGADPSDEQPSEAPDPDLIVTAHDEEAEEGEHEDSHRFDLSTEELRPSGPIGLTSGDESALTSPDLDPGTYVLECYVLDDTGQFHSTSGMIETLEAWKPPTCT